MKMIVLKDLSINTIAEVFKDLFGIFCQAELEVFAQIRVVMEFMQKDLESLNEIFEII